MEHAHHVVKTELAAAALPSGKVGANAAWFRLNVLTYNLLTALKRLTLPGDLRTARPKRMRFFLFHTVGKVVAHARPFPRRHHTFSPTGTKLASL